ncbi:hypothetical protein OIU84_008796 [Salix udensis]|uniref:Uncharacterized protein n=1 Tax=Salix udensis TaxID=889485 RepID=A0AAD6NXP1_9ROSI|nr:hypothetical protein OIU84_008796 [Salix udensis]
MPAPPKLLQAGGDMIYIQPNQPFMFKSGNSLISNLIYCQNWSRELTTKMNRARKNITLPTEAI